MHIVADCPSRVLLPLQLVVWPYQGPYLWHMGNDTSHPVSQYALHALRVSVGFDYFLLLLFFFCSFIPAKKND